MPFLDEMTPDGKPLNIDPNAVIGDDPTPSPGGQPRVKQPRVDSQKPLDGVQPDPDQHPSQEVSDSDYSLPSWANTFGATFRSSANEIGSTLSQKTLGVDINADDPRYSAWDDIKGTKYEPYANSFISSNNERYTNALKAQIDMQEEDNRTMAASGWRGTLAQLAAGLLNPSNLVPGGELMSASKTGFSMARGAATFGAASALHEVTALNNEPGRTAGDAVGGIIGGTLAGAAFGGVAGKGMLKGMAAGAGVGAAQEAVAHAQDPNRDWGSTALNIGFNVMLGHLIGAHAAAAMTPAERDAAAQAMAALHAGEGVPSAQQMTRSGEEWRMMDIKPSETLDQRANNVETALTSQSVEAGVNRLQDHRTSAIAESLQRQQANAAEEALMSQHPDETPAKAQARSIENLAREQRTQDANATADSLLSQDVDRLRAQHADAVENALTESTKPVEASAAQPSASGGAPRAGGADVTRQPTNADLAVAPGWAAVDKTANMTKAVSPNMRGFYRLVASMRKYTQMASENTLYTAMNMKGESLGPSAETMMNVNHKARMGAGLIAHNALYKEMKKSSINMPEREFGERVGEAMRNNDEDANPFVAKSAKSWRDKVFDPWLHEAVEHGLLPPDVTVETAPSYFSRVWLKKALVSQEGRFKGVAQQHFEEHLSQLYSDDFDAIKGRTSKLDQQAADLKLNSADRVSALKDLETKAEALDAANPQHIQRAEDLSDLRQQLREEKDKNKGTGRNEYQAVTALEKQIKDMKDAGGDDFKNYLAQRKELRSRQKQIDLNYAGMMSRHDQIAQSLDKNAEGNRASLSKLVDKGRSFQKEAQRLDPKKYDERLSDLRSGFAKLAERATKSADRFAQQLEKLRGESKADETTPENSASAARAQDILDKRIKVERSYADQIDKVSKRLEATENFDPKATLEEVRKGVDALIDRTSRLSLERGEKSQRLKDRAEALDPKIVTQKLKDIEQTKRELTRDFYDKWERDRLAEGVDHENKTTPDFRNAAKDASDQVFDHLVGNRTSSNSDPSYHVPITRGPLKDRVFNIQDHLVAPWLENDVRQVAHHYSSTMAAEVELTRRFGRADMRDQFDHIKQEYRDLREKIDAAKNPEEVKALMGQQTGVADRFQALLRRQDLGQSVKERALAAVNKDEKDGVRDLSAIRDLKRGTYKQDVNSGNWARIVRGTMAFNYIRSMGGFVSSNLSMLYRPAMVHGLSSVMMDGIRPLLKNLDSIVGDGNNPYSKSINELKLAGVPHERILHGQMASLSELGDNYGKGNQVERLLDNGSKLATKLNFMATFFDYTRSMAGVMTQHRMLNAVTKGGDKPYLGYLGIGSDMARVIAGEFANHGETLDGVHVANTEKWENNDAVRAYRGAISKDVSSILHHKSVGDIPLFGNTPTGRMILQFRTFNIAAHQRTMLRGMQESPTRFVTSMAAMTGLGMMSSYLTAWRGGKDNFDRFKKESLANPAHWIADGLDKSGIFTLPFEAANLMERSTGGMGPGFSFNPIKTPVSMLGGHAGSGFDPGVHGAARDPISAFLGPSAGIPFGLAETAGGAMNALRGAPVTKQQSKAAAGMTPFGSYYGMRELIQAMQGTSPYTRP